MKKIEMNGLVINDITEEMQLGTPSTSWELTHSIDGNIYAINHEKSGVPTDWNYLDKWKILSCPFDQDVEPTRAMIKKHLHVFFMNTDYQIEGDIICGLSSHIVDADLVNSTEFMEMAEYLCGEKLDDAPNEVIMKAAHGTLCFMAEKLSDQSSTNRIVVVDVEGSVATQITYSNGEFKSTTHENENPLLLDASNMWVYHTYQFSGCEVTMIGLGSATRPSDMIDNQFITAIYTNGENVDGGDDAMQNLYSNWNPGQKYEMTIIVEDEDKGRVAKAAAFIVNHDSEPEIIGKSDLDEDVIVKTLVEGDLGGYDFGMAIIRRMW